MKKWLSRILSFILILLVVGYIYGYFNLKDRHPDYWLDLKVEAGQAAPLKAGFAAIPITPPVEDTWTDVNGDAQYNPDDGDTYEDVNGNGQFDPYWMAGFQNKRPAQGVHDDLWARTMVIDDGTTRLAWVVVDLIGYSSDDIIWVRKKVAESAGVDYIIVSNTHTHEGPDLLGLWGDGYFSSGVNPEYRTFVQDQAAKSVEEAVANLRPAKLRFSQDLEGAKDLVEDSRPPIVMDYGLRFLQAVDAENGNTLGTLLAWANHPETLWNENLEITSDFAHYFREYVEKGISRGDSLIQEGLGGIALYANGNIGGLMTTSPDFEIKDPFSDETYLEATFEKADAQGAKLAMLAFNAMNDTTQVVEIEEGSIALKAKSLLFPLDNPIYRLGAYLGVLDRGLSGWWKMRSEICFWEIGPAQFLHHPAEMYPEMVNGGVEAPEGGDFDIEPVEVPPLREKMTAQFKFVMGLSNDMIGYTVPKSQWDEEAPYTYELENAPYGEINSLGSETAPMLHKALLEIMEEKD